MKINNSDTQLFLDKILFWVQTPSQYVGKEWNSVYKDFYSAETRFCLSFPDTYALGMSYHGLKLLYEIVNNYENFLCERAFAPLPDFIQYLKKYDMPLFSLESKTPIRDFDIWGFSVSSELNWANVLQMLDLAKVPILADDRTENDPIIIAGGHGVYNPEPVAPFLDIVVLGDGEEILPALLRMDYELRRQKVCRKQRILEMARTLPGLYAPNFYEITYNKDNTIAEIIPQHGLPAQIDAQFIKNLDDYQLFKPLIGYEKTVHNRIFLEIMRGCTRGCRFCQAGMIRRPLRIASVDSLVKQAVELYKNTGYEEICLYSLASSDYPYLKELTSKLLKIFADKYVGISLPSLRINDQLKVLPEIIASVRKRGLTLAPEVGTERMQNIVNKAISTDEMLEAIEMAYNEGWNAIKLYFMIGLPFQDEKDYDGIVDLAHKVSQKRKNEKRGAGNVSASISTFVPKCNTPFQWSPMAKRDDVFEVQKKIKRAVRSPKITLNFHSTKFTKLEALIARGNRKVANVILDAWKNGAYLDAWDEYFNADAWDNACKKHNIESFSYLYNEISIDEKLPWSHLNAGVSLDFLKSEWQKAKSGELTANCMDNKCNKCGIEVKYCQKTAK